MHESLHSIRVMQPPVPASRRDGRGKRAPFTLIEEPPGELAAPPSEDATAAGAAERAYCRLELGPRLDDEEGQQLDVTA